MASVPGYFGSRLVRSLSDSLEGWFYDSCNYSFALLASCEGLGVVVRDCHTLRCTGGRLAPLCIFPAARLAVFYGRWPVATSFVHYIEGGICLPLAEPTTALRRRSLGRYLRVFCCILAACLPGALLRLCTGIHSSH